MTPSRNGKRSGRSGPSSERRASPSTDYVPARTPPHDVQAEMGVLGSAILHPELVPRIAQELRPECFYRLAHQDIWEAMIELHERAGSVDVVLLRDALARREQLEKCGGQSYLVELAEATPTSANVEYYASIVREKWQRRRLIEQYTSAAVDLYEDGCDAAAIAARTVDVVDAALFQSAPTEPDRQRLERAWEEIVAEFERRGRGDDSGHITVGLRGFDTRLRSLQPGRLTVIVGSPGSGKTALACWLMIQHGLRDGKSLFFSAEMTMEDVMVRMTQQLAGLAYEDIASGRLSQGAFQEWQRAGAWLRKGLIIVRDTAGIDVEDLLMQAREVVPAEGVSMIVVDYIQLLGSRSHDKMNEQVADAARQLKLLARETRTAVVALSQRTMTDHGPMARWSQDIHIHADAMIFIQRSAGVERNEEAEDPVVRHRLLITKNRFGPEGGFAVWFDKPRMLFSDEEPDYEHPESGGDGGGVDGDEGEDRRAVGGERGAEGSRPTAAQARAAARRAGRAVGDAARRDRGGASHEATSLWDQSAVGERRAEESEESPGVADGQDVPEDEIPF